ncbi:MAG: hypothetical protein ACRD0O_21070, partial [Acidimicrobiia bacterium]
ALGMAAAMDPAQAKELEEVRAKADPGDVPEEIRDDYEVMLEYAADLGELLSKYDLKSGNPDPQAIAAIAAFSERADTQHLQTASENVSAWIGAHCAG